MKRLAATYAVVACAPPIGVSPCRNRALKKEQPAMVYGAIDLHMRYSQIRVIDAAGAVVRDQRVPTTRERLGTAFAGVGGVRVVLEAGTESEWVAGALEAAGHEVIVVDPNYAPMYGEVHRRVKTDRRDVTALAEANRRGWYRAVHRVSAAQRATRQVLRTRRQLVQTRGGAGACVAATGRLSAAVVRGRAGPGAAPVAGAAGAARGDAGAAGAADHRDDDGDRRAGGGAAAARRARSRHAHAADGPRGRADRGVDLPGAVG